MRIDTVRTEGLGDSTYVLTHGGMAVVIDPQRDIDRFEDILSEIRADLRFVLETHLHNDYLSGGRELAGRAGAELVLPSGAAPAFRHTPAFHNEDLEGGPIIVRPLHTPGHTPEHMSYLIWIDGEPVAVFTGGSLLVGSAGRCDLLGPERADTLTRLQYLSVNRLAALPDPVGLYPTHGAGSFCAVSQTGRVTSTIGAEKRSNPVLAHRDIDSFLEDQLGRLSPYPAYYRHMGPANIMGPPPMPPLSAPTVGRDAVEGVDDAMIIDARPLTDFAAAHIRGSLGIGLREDFGVWVGWVVPHDSPLMLVLDPTQDLDDALRQLTRIGFDHVLGVIRDLSEWKDELTAYRTVSVPETFESVAAICQIVDARAPGDWETGTIPGSILRYAPDLARGDTEDIDRDRPVLIVCGTGYRATVAASFLERDGYEPIVAAGVGVTEVLREISKRGGRE